MEICIEARHYYGPYVVRWVPLNADAVPFTAMSISDRAHDGLCFGRNVVQPCTILAQGNYLILV